MAAIDDYIKRLADPAVIDHWRKVYRLDDADEGGWTVAEGQVAAAEASLGFPLPPSYRMLVLTTRPDQGPNNMVYWIGDGDRELIDIVTARDGESGIIPPFLIPVVDHEDGNFDCFDTRSPGPLGEYPIVRFDHEVHDEDSEEFEVVAQDLGDYLLGSLGGETQPES